MQIGDQVYVRRSDVSRWTSAVVVKLGPKQVYKVVTAYGDVKLSALLQFVLYKITICRLIFVYVFVHVDSEQR